MMTVNPLEIEGMQYTAVTVELPRTTLLVISNEVGYIMCGALDVDLLNDRLADRKVISGRAAGVKTIDELLEAPLEKITNASKVYGWEPGMTGKDALLKIA
ncbi:YunC family protein [Barrientosiimonas marina]|uniref:YunC family protein n=1 Tax=Lentibacillus kimchii TaxID=1542911 RepID=A0ABW2UU61_9BACI